MYKLIEERKQHQWYKSQPDITEFNAKLRR